MMRNRLRKTISEQKQGGFTLIELLLVVALLSITAGVSGDIIISVTQSYNKTHISNEIEQVANFTLSKLEKELRNSRGVRLPPATPLHTPSNTLSFIDRNNNRVCYNITGGAIQRSISSVYPPPDACGTYVTLMGANSLVAVETGTGAFVRTNNNPEIVKLNITFQQAGTLNTSYTGTVTLSNTIVVRGTY